MTAAVFRASLLSLLSACAGPIPPEPLRQTPLPRAEVAEEPARAVGPQSPAPPPTASPVPAPGFPLSDPPASTENVLRGDAALEIVRPLRRCSDLVNRLPVRRVADGMTELAALRNAETVEVWTESHGNGVWHEEKSHYMIARPADCAALAVDESYYFESWITDLRFEALGVSGPDGAQRFWLVSRALALVPGARVEERAGDSRTGAAWLKMVGAIARTPDSLPDSWTLTPSGTPQSERSGPPLGDAGLYVEASEHGAPRAAAGQEGQPPPDAFVVGHTDAPRAALRAGRYTLWQSPLRIRQSGALLAVQDRSSDRHRWACLIAPGVPRWLGVRDGIAFGIAQTQHPVFVREEALFAVDLRSAQCHRIETPLALGDDHGAEHRYSSVRLAGDALELASGDASLRIPVREVRARIDEAAQRSRPAPPP